tara:strand:- start:26 stop:580 length:555 start_codon:yes stop_codon:yes gene_type:complete
MNRRDFIKKTGAVGALGTWTVTCQYEEKEHDPKGEKGEVGETGCRWDYRVYCYERGQGQWVFSENIKGSFAPEREYLNLEEERTLPYVGWMDGGKLHFMTLEEAQDFVDAHVRAKDDTNVIDSIYDIYYIKRELDPTTQDLAPELRYIETEMQVAHYWFNGDTGRQVEWVTNKPCTDYSKVDCA